MNAFRWQTAIVLVAIAAVTVSATSQRRKIDARPSKAALELDGRFAGWLDQTEGPRRLAERGEGELKPVGGEGLPSVGSTGLLAVNASFSKNVLDWISASWNMNYQRKNGAIVQCDSTNKVLGRIEFKNALITEIGFPALDRTSAGPGVVQLQLKPESTQMRKAGGGEVIQNPLGTTQKQWLPSNFKLEIDGFDCRNVTKIGPQIMGGRLVRLVREKDPAPSSDPHFEAPNLTFLMPEADFKKNLGLKSFGPEYGMNKIMRGKLTVPDSSGKGGYRFTIQTTSLKATKSEGGMVAVSFKTSTFKLEFF
jgi:hypothetical protein